jgi:hypothetical protein
MKARYVPLVLLLITVAVVMAKEATAAPFAVNDCPSGAASALVEITCGGGENAPAQDNPLIAALQAQLDREIAAKPGHSRPASDGHRADRRAG